MAARPYGGSVVVRRCKTDDYYSLRFTANGRRRSQKLGPAGDGWTLRKAEEALQALMVDVRRGVWVAPEDVVVEAPMPRFHQFASEWYERQKIAGGRRGSGLSEAGSEDLEWRLSEGALAAKHYVLNSTKQINPKVVLLPFFDDHLLPEITVAEVDRFRDVKVRERQEIQDAAAKGKPIIDKYTDSRGRKCHRPRRALSNTSINKVLGTLAAILEVAVEYNHIPANPARGRRRRPPSVTPQRSWLDRAEHIDAMLDAAGELDEKARARRGQRRALRAVLVYSGLRIGEALALRWRDVNLADGKITVRASKTDAGIRKVNMLPVLRDELDRYPQPVAATPEGLVFGTSTGARQGESNVRRRILEPAVELANMRLRAKDEFAEELPRLTPHSLRRSYASLMFAIGRTPPEVMDAMGHTTAGLTPAFYAKAMRADDQDRDRLRILVEGHTIGTRAQIAAEETLVAARD